jgi:mRNA interferase MazF
MARKNHRKQYHSRRLSADLFRLTKRKTTKPTNSGGASLTSTREKDKHMENAVATNITSTPAIAPRPVRPQGVDDPRITRGSVWFADLAPRSTSNLITSVQTGTRPVLVISNDLNNRFGTVITVVPFTGAPKRLDMPTHVAVIPSDVRNGYMPSEIYESTLLAEQVTALDKSRLVSYVGTVVNPKLMEQVEAALLTQIGINTALPHEKEAVLCEN